MEENADAGAPVAPVAENKQKSGNGLKIATVIACIVAVCGIGFGVYGMMQSSDKDKQISDLKTQTDNINKEITIDDSYEKFADNLADNYEAHLFSYDGEDSVSIEVENSHLTISDFNVDGRGGGSVFAESDNIISVYLEIGRASCRERV